MSQESNSYHLGGGPPPATKVSAAGLERAKGLFRGWKAILRHHRCPKEVLEDCRRQLLGYLNVESEADFFKRAKYVGVMYMAWYLRVEMPEAPDADFKHTGRWRGWARSRRFVNRANTHLWYSLLQAKRCAMPLSQDMVLATYEKHRVAMSREDPIDQTTLESVFDGLLGVLEPVRRALTKAYRTRDDLEVLSETSWAPSENAAFEASKANGGQKQVLIDVATCRRGDYVSALGEAAAELFGIDDADDDSSDSDTDDPEEEEADTYFDRASPSAPAATRVLPDLVRMQFFPKVVLNGRVYTNHVVEYYEYVDRQGVWDDTLTDAVLQYDTGRPLKCTIYGILEPLKIRVISKGEAVPYYASKELQKRLHAILRSYDCFRLIGRPLCPTDLMDCAANPVKTGTGKTKWFSVDYSSATDCLSASLSARILGYLIQDLPKRMQEIWLRVLAPHLCEYPPVKVKKTGGKHDSSRCEACQAGVCSGQYQKVEVPPVLQKNGQLMGSPLSFPILCLANLGLYLEVIRDDPRSLQEKLAGVLVNGDDMLYVAPESLWERHISLGRTVGLEMTPGKAYKHTVFANANSTCFHYDLENEGSTPWQIDFLNTGLLFGQNKVLQKDVTVGAEAQHHRVPVINQLLKGALPGKQKGLFKDYLRRHKEDIREECAGRNLFIDPSLGGMGVNPPLGWAWDVTDRQRMTASVMAQKLGRFAEFGNGPLRGVELPQPLDKVHPFMRLETSEKESFHKYSWEIKKSGTFLRSALLQQPVRLASFGIRGWRNAFLHSSLVSLPVRRVGLSPTDRWERDLLREQAGVVATDC